jgi:chromate transporter
VAAALVSAATSLGIVGILILAGCAGLLFLQPKRPGVRAWALSSALALAVLSAPWWLHAPMLAWSGAGRIPNAKSLMDLGAYFFTLGAFTIGGGLTMIAFIQDQVVGQFGWLTPREFIDGLALGQLTPGPVLMIAAYVGYKVAGIAGATVAAVAAFLPSFVIMLVVLPVLDRVRQLAWTRAVMRGMGPAVIGMLAVSLVRLAPAALPDLFAVVILVATLAVLVALRAGAFQAMIAGAVLGVLRSQWPVIRGAGAAARLIGS